MLSVTGTAKRIAHLKGVRGALYRLRQGGKRTAFAGVQVASFIRAARTRTDCPTVTAVVVGRNDDYMPDFSDRLQATIEWNAWHLAREVIFVEWNPPEDRELLSVPLARAFPFVHAYVVDPSVHREICKNDSLPLLEYHAKNVGIRRASGEWVVSTNADAAFAPDLVANLLSSGWPRDVVWTAERVDILWREGRRSRLRLTDCLRYRRWIPFEDLGTGEFDMASRDLWCRAGGFDESLVRHRIGADRRGVAQLVHRGGETRRAGIVLHMSHPSSCVDGVRDHHGERAGLDGIPYNNGPDWGLASRTETEITERVWRIT